MNCPITRPPRKLSQIQGDDPLILTLARGHYCPKEHQQHLELAAFYPKIAVAYTQMATIATDDHHTLQEFRASVGAQWTFLSDPGRTIQKDLDIQEYTDPEHNPMIPYTLVLKPGLVIYSIYNGYWFWGRPSIADLWRDLRIATSEVRPDWDLSTPGLREAWNAGDHSRFHGWNKHANKVSSTQENGNLWRSLNRTAEQNLANGFASSPEESDIQSGTPLPIGGPHQQGDGVCFVLFSRHATVFDWSSINILTILLRAGSSNWIQCVIGPATSGTSGCEALPGTTLRLSRRRSLSTGRRPSL